jgi:hypothetical protein
MTVAFNDAYTQYTGTGVRTFFEFGFPILPGSQVYVLVDGLPVLINQQTTGIVFDNAPILDATIEIFRLTDVTQLSDFEPFESFDAAKTEDAVDKLIMLKQEGWFRAAMNLFADPRLDRVILVNDKGDDAHILIWNEHTQESLIINDAGVFAGLVTTNMPCPGAVVEKPDHFAYFQYGLALPPLVLTTTLYPIELTDGLDFSVALQGGLLVTWPLDDLDVSFSVVGGNMQLGLLDYGPDNDDLDVLFSVVGGNMQVILLTYGPDNDDLDVTFSVVDGNMEPKLVTIDTPDEGLEFGLSLIAGSLETA